MKAGDGQATGASRRAIGIGLIGVGGYGAVHRKVIRRLQELGVARLVAAVILPGLEPEVELELRGQGVLICRTHGEMFARASREAAGGMELVGVPCGIGQHAPLSIAALRAGYHVLCEKPAAGNHREALEMQRVARETGKILAIGFQNMYSPTMRRLKALALEGMRGDAAGRLIGAKLAARWPRDASYYARNAWAGRLSVDGRLINDSPVQNALAHYLQDMLFVAGPDERSCATPVRLYGENYRAKRIESADTQFLRIATREGPTVTFMATHACGVTRGPIMELAFEHVVVRWWTDAGLGRIEVRDAATGRVVETLDNGPDDLQALPYRNVIEAIGSGGRPITTIDNCIQHALCVDALFRGCGVVPVAGEHTDTGPEATGDTRIAEIDELMDRMFEEGRSFFEAGAPWAGPGKSIDLG